MTSIWVKPCEKFEFGKLHQIEQNGNNIFVDLYGNLIIIYKL